MRILNPLAQQIIIPRNEAPRGLFLSSIEVYFSQKDNNLPVSLQLRTLINSFPSNVILPYSEVVVNASNVVTSEFGDAATKFTFDVPVYLEPGEYCFILHSNSESYRVFASELGGIDVQTNQLIDRSPYTGALYQGQNDSVWSVTLNSCLKFKLNRCSFDTTAREIILNSRHSNTQSTEYETVYVQSHALTFPNTVLNFELNTRDRNSNTMVGFTPIITKTNTLFPSTRVLTANVANSAQIKMSISTTDSYVSPMIDMSRLAGYYVKNIVNARDDANPLPETLPAGGYAQAKYVTEMITLRDGVDDASSMRVYLDVSRLQGTDFEVYYKVLHRLDNARFDAQPYFKMNRLQRVPEFVDTNQQYLPFELEANNITYTAASGAVYDSFKYYAIKIVMYSSNPAYVPLFKNLKVVATS